MDTPTANAVARAEQLLLKHLVCFAKSNDNTDWRRAQVVQQALTAAGVHIAEGNFRAATTLLTTLS